MTRHGTPVGDPGPFTCLFFTPLSTAGFWGNRSPSGKPNADVFAHLRWRLLSGPGGFLFFLLNWALCGPNRPLTWLGRIASPPGVKTGHTGPTGGNQGACRFCGTAECGWFPQVPEGTQGAHNSARGEWAEFASLAGNFPRVQGGNVQGCTLQLLHNM